MLSQEEIVELIADRESDRVERTIATDDTDKFAEAICAFSNDLANHKKPGYLLIGVHDKSCKLTGLKVTDRLLKNIAAIRSDGNILPQPAMTVHSYTFDEGDVVAIEVLPAHFPPVRYKGTVWVRIGPRRGVANEMEERLLTEKRTSNAKTFDERPCFGATMDDLNLTLFKMVYLPKAVSAEILANDKRDIKLQLASLRFYDLVYDCPTNAGILMFGNNVRYFFSTAYVQYVKFEGKTKASNVLADVQFAGDLISIVNGLDSFVKINVIKKRPIRVSALIEENVFNYSDSAIREFLMNALMHRSYEITSYIKFYQFSDRIEIENPGGLYGNARPENFPNVSDYRNLVIAESMRVMGYVNRFNRGIEEAQLALKNNGNEPAEFDLKTFGVFGVKMKEKRIENISSSFSDPRGDDTLNDTLNGTLNGNGTINDTLNDPLNENGAINDTLNDPLNENGTINDTLNDTLNENGTINGTINDPLNADGTINDDLTKILDLIHKQSGINQSNIVYEIKKSRMTVFRYLNTLKGKGLIEYKGSRKTGGYYLTEKGRDKLK